MSRNGTTSVDSPNAGKKNARARRQYSGKLASRDSLSRDAKQRAAAILEVLGGLRTPADAAQALSVSLPRYYLLEQTALEGLVKACEPRNRGPRAQAGKQIVRLEREMEKLRRDSARQQALLRAAQRTVGLSPPKPIQPDAKISGRRRKRRPTARALRAAAALKSETAAAGLFMFVGAMDAGEPTEAAAGPAQARRAIDEQQADRATTAAASRRTMPDICWTNTACIYWLRPLIRRGTMALARRGSHWAGPNAVHTGEPSERAIGPTQARRGVAQPKSGPVKCRCHERASLPGEPGCWSAADARAARLLANGASRPHGDDKPTPDEAWHIRQPLALARARGIRARS